MTATMNGLRTEHYATGNGEIGFERWMQLENQPRTPYVSELGELGLNDLGGGSGGAGCAD